MIIYLAEYGLDEFRISQYAPITFKSIPRIITWCKTPGCLSALIFACILYIKNEIILRVILFFKDVPVSHLKVPKAYDRNLSVFQRFSKANQCLVPRSYPASIISTFIEKQVIIFKISPIRIRFFQPAFYNSSAITL